MTQDEQDAAVAKVAAYKAMPHIVTTPGDYQTRDGRRVTIHGISAAMATGAIWKEFRGKFCPRGYFGWDFNGRRNVLAERPSDIIGCWSVAA